MKRTLILGTAGFAAAATALVAMAGPGGMGPPLSIDEAAAHKAAMIKQADINGDGGVTLDEFKLPRRGPHGKQRDEQRAERHAEHLPELFTRLDTDNDGSLSATEFESLPAVGHELAREKVFEQLDTDGDGRLTMADTSPMERHIADMDTDGDGFVSREERRAARAARREARETRDAAPF